MTPTFKITGMSLVETLIAMALGLSALAAACSLVAGAMAVSEKSIQQARLQEELTNTLNSISRDLRRAGYAANALDVFSSAPPADFNRSLGLGQFTSEDVNSCITFRYDANANGVLDTVSPNEQFGFRLRDNSVEIRKDGAPCDAAGWEDLTDSHIVTVTQLEFAAVETLHHNIRTTTVYIDLAGELVNSRNRHQAVYSTSVRLSNASY